MSAQSDIAWYKGFAIKKKWKEKKWDTGAAQDCCMLPRKDDIKYKHSPKLMDVIINYEKDALQMLHEGHMKQDKNINERAVQHCWVQRLRNKKKAKKKGYGRCPELSHAASERRCQMRTLPGMDGCYLGTDDVLQRNKNSIMRKSTFASTPIMRE